MDRKRAWYLANKEKCHKAQKKYRTSNPEKIKISARRSVGLEVRDGLHC
jgi:hypothetical protein